MVSEKKVVIVQEVSQDVLILVLVEDGLRVEAQSDPNFYRWLS